MQFFNYPMGTDTMPTCSLPGEAANTPNCRRFKHSVVGDLIDVGSHVGSPSPNGTFDQSGNVWEWDQAILRSTSDYTDNLRGTREASFCCDVERMAASTTRFASQPIASGPHVGFRVASLPVVPIEIDIKPGADLNPIAQKSPWVVPVGVRTAAAYVGAWSSQTDDSRTTQDVV